MLGLWMQWVAFGLFTLLTVLGALGMTTTMSMFRSGIFLMASFIGVAGLFILLSADLIGLLQIMMYIGGMLVMILFMLLFSMDPGGAMMAGMEMSPVERMFSRGLKPQGDEQDSGHSEHQEMGGEGQSDGEKSHDHAGMHHAGMDNAVNDQQMNEDHAMPHDDAENDQTSEEKGDQHGQMNHSGMDHGDVNDMDGDMDMSMVTPARPWAAWLGLAVSVVLVALLLWRPAWPITNAAFSTDSPQQIGTLLMGKYMIAFEGTGLLILLGIFGAVFLQRPGSHPSDQGRGAYVTAEENPVGISEDGP